MSADIDSEAEITRALVAYLADPSILTMGPGLVVVASYLHALPVYLDMGGALLLRPDGQILSVHADQKWCADSEWEVVTDARWRTVALITASERFSNLAFLRPQRPATAVDCPACQATGHVYYETLKREFWCNECQSLGWVSNDST